MVVQSTEKDWWTAFRGSIIWSLMERIRPLSGSWRLRSRDVRYRAS